MTTRKYTMADLTPEKPVSDLPSLMPARDWMERELAKPEPDYLIHGIVIPHGLTVISGEPKMGKSFAALQMLFAATTGIPMGMMHSGGKRVRAAHIDLDGPARAAAKRMQWFLRGHDLTANALSDNYQMLDTRRFQMLDIRGRANLMSELRDVGAQLLVVDTLAESFGGDENSTQEMNAFVRTLRELRDETGVAVALVHHFNKDSGKKFDGTMMSYKVGLRGSTILAGAFDNTISFQSGPLDGQPDQHIVVAGGKNEGDWHRSYDITTMETGEFDPEGNATIVVKSIEYGPRKGFLRAWEPIGTQGKFGRGR